MATGAMVSGPTSARVAENVERLRKVRGMGQADLVERLGELGHPMLKTAISKIERGNRRMDVDDLVAIALALNVSPVALLMPATDTLDKVALTKEFSVTEQSAWLWAAGDAPASDFLLDPVGNHADEEHRAYWALREQYLHASHPPGRFAPGKALIRTVSNLRAEIDRLFAHVNDTGLDDLVSDSDFDEMVARNENWISKIRAELDFIVAGLRRRRAYRKAMPVRHPGVPFDEGIPLEEFRNNPVALYPRSLELRDLGVDDPDLPK